MAPPSPQSSGGLLDRLHRCHRGRSVVSGSVTVRTNPRHTVNFDRAGRGDGMERWVGLKFGDIAQIEVGRRFALV
jgi:hypothetical protein